MVAGENPSGRPLADFDWLEAHHRAKLPERTAFVERLVDLGPKTIVDLGCATGLWLELLHEQLPPDCRFVGIDADEQALAHALERSQHWDRSVSLLQLDIEAEAELIPPADLTLAFNVFSYIEDLDGFLVALWNRTPSGTLAVRQYDGASIRFGPMRTSERQELESSLRSATEGSAKFNHYDLDRTFEALRACPSNTASFEFETFARFDPFPEEFDAYYTNTLEWTRSLVSDAAAVALQKWTEAVREGSGRYFYEVDLVALLS